MPELRPCPYCRGYDLERRWCHVCNGRGVVDVKAQQRERAEIVYSCAKPELKRGTDHA